MTKKVIVGYDASDEAREALAWAASEASASSAEVRIVTCYENPAFDSGLGYLPITPITELVEIAQQELAAAEAGVRAYHPDLEVRGEVGGPSVAAAILEGAEAEDLVVIGGGKRRGAAAFWLGTTPRAVLHDAVCPVVVVRGAASRGRPDRILVGIDGSKASEDALTWACDEANLHRVPLMVVHAWEYPLMPTRVETKARHDEMRVDAACVLDRAAETARERCGVEVLGALVEDSPRAALLEMARDGDLIVLGSRGRGGLAAGILGSTANSVLDQAAVPVVVVHPRPHDLTHIT